MNKEKVSDKIVELAQFVEEEDWSTVLEIVLDMNQESFENGANWAKDFFNKQ